MGNRGKTEIFNLLTAKGILYALKISSKNEFSFEYKFWFFDFKKNTFFDFLSQHATVKGLIHKYVY